VLAALAGLAAAGPASAAPREPDRAAFALVVGSNAGGQGQVPLRFAERDARRMADVLRELGGYASDHVQLVQHPSRAELFAALDVLAERAVGEAAAGRPPRIFFYYSGHARSSALNLGREELPLADLRERLVGISGGLTVVVLDACQSGAFSRVKGAEPTADFSFNSLARLSATGVAVLASSSASELSQESDRLGASYFTHHLLVGLRGAGDASGDGQVSLDEAYRYAYHRTLVSTSATAVGAQHVSLEVDLKGRGEVPITYPAAADARLELPGPIHGEVLVEQRRARAVVAELHKVRGAPVRLALPAGDYRVLVRPWRSDVQRRCDVTLARGRATAVGPLDRCEEVELVDESAKGERPWYRPRVAAEFALAALRPIDDGFNDTLTGFGYRKIDSDPLEGLRFSGRAVASYGPYLSVVGSFLTLGGGEYRRDGEVRELVYDWQTYAASIGVRAGLPLLGGRATPYVELGGGPAMATTSFTGPTGDDDDQFEWGWHLGATGGLAVKVARHVSLFAEASWVTAPVIDNLVGDTHDSGGVIFSLGGRADIYQGYGP
jgi:hypothetical protein